MMVWSALTCVWLKAHLQLHIDKHLAVPRGNMRPLFFSSAIPQAGTDVRHTASAGRDPTLFVSAVAYREPECHATLKDMFAKVPLDSNLLFPSFLGQHMSASFPSSAHLSTTSSLKRLQTASTVYTHHRNGVVASAVAERDTGEVPVGVACIDGTAYC